ncbi:MAG: Hsp70 family protein [Spirochaetia bacterium]
MSDSTIGIKIANRSYFPIIEERAEQKKRLVLTTVNDNQSSVQIDLYRGDGKELQNALYIGSLIIDNIEPASKGDPEVELVLGIDQEKNLIATAADISSGQKQSLSVSLDALEEDNLYDIPDFDIDPTVNEELEEEPEEEMFAESAVISEPIGREVRRSSPWLIVGLVILGLIILGIAGFFIYRSISGEEIPPLLARGENQETVVQEEEPPEIEEPSEAEESAAADTAEEPPAEPPPAEPPPEGGPEPEVLGGAWYWIKRGDTLWDLSASFYRTPWHYGIIARWNGIENPDLIYTDSKIFIPEL